MLVHVYSSLIGDKVKRNPGDRWMISGPRDYVPPIEVTIIESRYHAILVVLLVSLFCCRKAVALNKNEGIYVRDTRNGQVGCTLFASLFNIGVLLM